uniref:Uncharacterized protein n=1 Tax=Physcomitrium patens TaxID=3218 RepID=A0A2K1KVK2_PHYPA|nr:hypothetical protein PHYPA_004770 [Physcomitrium patens]
MLADTIFTHLPSPSSSPAILTILSPIHATKARPHLDHHSTLLSSTSPETRPLSQSLLPPTKAYQPNPPSQRQQVSNTSHAAPHNPIQPRPSTTTRQTHSPRTMPIQSRFSLYFKAAGRGEGRGAVSRHGEQQHNDGGGERIPRQGRHHPFSFICPPLGLPWPWSCLPTPSLPIPPRLLWVLRLVRLVGSSRSRFRHASCLRLDCRNHCPVPSLDLHQPTTNTNTTNTTSLTRRRKNRYHHSPPFSTILIFIIKAVHTIAIPSAIITVCLSGEGGERHGVLQIPMPGRDHLPTDGGDGVDGCVDGCLVLNSVLLFADRNALPSWAFAFSWRTRH